MGDVALDFAQGLRPVRQAQGLRQLVVFFVQFFGEMEFEVVGFGEGFFQELDGMIGILQRHGLFREEIEVAPGEVLGGGSGMGSGGLAASFHEVVDAQGADRVHEAHVDAALGDGLAFCVEAGGFVNGDVANGARREDALGAGEVEGAGVIEAVERIDAGDPGEDAAFFFVGEERDVGLRILDCGLRIADFRLRMGQATGRCFRCGGDLRRIGRDHRLQPFDFAQGLRHRRVPVAVRLVLRRWPWSRGQDTGSRDGWQIWRGVVCRKDFPKVGWLLTQAAACALRAACSKLSVSRPLGCRKVGVGGATPFGFCRKEAKKQRSKGCRGRKIQTAMGPLLPPAEY